VTRLTHFARGLMVALAALALVAGAALAARGGLPSASSVGVQHGNAAGGQTPKDARPDAEAPDSDKADDAETPDTDAPDAQTNADRAQNHGWFVSEAAKGPTPAAFDTQGAYVSSIAKGTQGKPDAAAKAATKAAAGKAKGAAARATHAGN
jgi:hypothetical protein